MVLVPKYWEDLFASLYAPESWLKVIILLAFIPIWLPTVRAMLREFLDSLNLEETRKLAPGEDPFLNVPLARHRQALAHQKELTPRARGNQRSAGGTRPGRSARAGITRRSGFAPTRR